MSPKLLNGACHMKNGNDAAMLIRYDDAMQEAVQLGSIKAICESTGATDLRDKLEASVLTENWLRAFLPEDEVAALHRLSVFSGSFDAVAAASVAFSAGAAVCQHV